VPSLKAWLEHQPKEQRPSLPASEAMEAEASAYYFHHYMKHFADGPVGRAYRSIPYAMTWDDHDIFDVGAQAASGPSGRGHGGYCVCLWLLDKVGLVSAPACVG
jgi:hypothetical protein